MTRLRCARLCPHFLKVLKEYILCDLINVLCVNGKNKTLVQRSVEFKDGYMCANISLFQISSSSRSLVPRLWDSIICFHYSSLLRGLRKRASVFFHNCFCSRCKFFSVWCAVFRYFLDESVIQEDVSIFYKVPQFFLFFFLVREEYPFLFSHGSGVHQVFYFPATPLCLFCWARCNIFCHFQDDNDTGNATGENSDKCSIAWEEGAILMRTCQRLLLTTC